MSAASSPQSNVGPGLGGWGEEAAATSDYKNTVFLAYM